MNFKKTMFAVAIGSVGIMGAMSASAAALFTGDKLSIVTGAVGSSGEAIAGTTSWFAMDTNGDSTIQLTEKTALSQGTTGIVIGTANTTLGQITSPWLFFSQTGMDHVTTPITGGTTGLDLSGWMVNWNSNDINLGSGAWQPLNTAGAGMAAGAYASGVAKFTWDGVYNHGYKLDYTATVPTGGIAGVQYALHLEGIAGSRCDMDCEYDTPIIPTIPESSTYNMLLAGLGLVGFMARRRRLVKV